MGIHNNYKKTTVDADKKNFLDIIDKEFEVEHDLKRIMIVAYQIMKMHLRNYWKSM